jgi:hypothetical protein
MSDLMNYSGSFFQGGRVIDPNVFLSYPNDYGLAWGGNQGELDLVNAKEAWAVDTGNANMVVGVIDQWVDTSNPDLKGKFALLRDDYYSFFTTSVNHGAAVCGNIAANTNNNIIMSGMCPGCKLDFATDRWGGNTYLIDTMSMMGRRVVNCSWMECSGNNAPPPIDEQMSYDEVYENGTSFVAAAGNMPQYITALNAYCPPYHHSYAYPASLNHSISVAGVGYDPSIKDIHERTPGDTTTSYTHNDRVTICAPAFNMHLLASASNNYYTIADGTSFAAPIVSGAAALLYAHRPALTPYQVEYILRKTANTNLFSIPYNFPYAGLLGAGRLDVGAALRYADTAGTNINDTSLHLETMVIQGVEINTICVQKTYPWTLNPQLTPIITGGTPPYRYKWNALVYTNRTSLDNDTIANPKIVGAYAPTYLADYYLEVSDASPITKKAGRHIQITLNPSNTWDLAMRDSYLDMLNEANTQAVVDPRQWQIWESPDIWNRVHQDGITSHEDPQYIGTTTPNYVYVKVRNVGCVASPTGAKLHLYWTKASTGEYWKGAWDTATYNGWPAGGEITNSTAITIPALAAGTDTILAYPWYPPRPQNYDISLQSVATCFLARIEDGHNAADPNGAGMTISEVANTSTNVRGNNNIVTRNMIVFNLAGIKPARHQVHIGNVNSEAAVFNFSLATDKYFQPYLAGNIAQLVASVTFTLSPTVFNSWVRNGAQGNYSEINKEAYSVTFSEISDRFQVSA